MSDDTFALTHPVVGRDGGDKLDFYPTPRACTEALIAHLAQSRPGWRDEPPEVLDPAAGEGAILDVWRERRCPTLGLEIDPVRAETARRRGHLMSVGDALERPWPRADLLAMNPPYSLAETFVRRALAWRFRTPGAALACALLRLSFLEPAKGRRDLLVQGPDVLILPRRPAFDGRGTDSITSAWFCWPGQGRLVWLPA